MTDYQSYIEAARFLLDHMQTHDCDIFAVHNIRKVFNRVLDRAVIMTLGYHRI